MSRRSKSAVTVHPPRASCPAIASSGYFGEGEPVQGLLGASNDAATLEKFVSWKALIRPPRRVYGSADLVGEFPTGDFDLCGTQVCRSDFVLDNDKGVRLACSLFEPVRLHSGPYHPSCVIYAHDSEHGSRLDAFCLVPAFLPQGVSLAALDFSGSGRSSGEYTGCGFHERQDLRLFVARLRALGYSSIGIWGRGVGAVAALLFTASDNSIAGLVLDSPFADLWELTKQTCCANTAIPSWAAAGLSVPLPYLLRMLVQQKAGFDICDVSPRMAASRCRAPALLIRGAEDTDVSLWHFESLKSYYKGPLEAYEMPGHTHHGQRALAHMARAVGFMSVALQPLQQPRGTDDIIGKHGPANRTLVEALEAVAHSRLLLYRQRGNTLRGGEESSLQGTEESVSELPSVSEGLAGIEACLGLVKQACEQSVFLRGASLLPRGMISMGSGGLPHLSATCPAEFAGHLVLHERTSSIALCWVLDEVLQSGGGRVNIAVVSPDGSAMSTAQFRRQANGSWSVGAETAEPLKALDLEVGSGHAVWIRMSDSGMRMALGGHSSGKTPLACRGRVHLWCLHWPRRGQGPNQGAFGGSVYMDLVTYVEAGQRHQLQEPPPEPEPESKEQGSVAADPSRPVKKQQQQHHQQHQHQQQHQPPPAKRAQTAPKSSSSSSSSVRKAKSGTKLRSTRLTGEDVSSHHSTSEHGRSPEQLPVVLGTEGDSGPPVKKMISFDSSKVEVGSSQQKQEKHQKEDHHLQTGQQQDHQPEQQLYQEDTQKQNLMQQQRRISQQRPSQQSSLLIPQHTSVQASQEPSHESSDMPQQNTPPPQFPHQQILKEQTSEQQASPQQAALQSSTLQETPQQQKTLHFQTSPQNTPPHTSQEEEPQQRASRQLTFQQLSQGHHHHHQQQQQQQQKEPEASPQYREPSLAHRSSEPIAKSRLLPGTIGQMQEHQTLQLLGKTSREEQESQAERKLHKQHKHEKHEKQVKHPKHSLSQIHQHAPLQALPPPPSALSLPPETLPSPPSMQKTLSAQVTCPSQHRLLQQEELLAVKKVCSLQPQLPLTTDRSSLLASSGQHSSPNNSSYTLRSTSLNEPPTRGDVSEVETLRVVTKSLSTTSRRASRASIFVTRSTSLRIEEELLNHYLLPSEESESETDSDKSDSVSATQPSQVVIQPPLSPPPPTPPLPEPEPQSSSETQNTSSRVPPESPKLAEQATPETSQSPAKGKAKGKGKTKKGKGKPAVSAPSPPPPPPPQSQRDAPAVKDEAFDKPGEPGSPEGTAAPTVKAAAPSLPAAAAAAAAAVARAAASAKAATAAITAEAKTDKPAESKQAEVATASSLPKDNPVPAAAAAKETTAAPPAAPAGPEVPSSPPAKGKGKVKGKGKGKGTEKGSCPPSPAGAGKAAGPPPPKAKGKAKAKGKSEPRKPDIVPRIPTKKLFWNPIQVQTTEEPNVWEKIHCMGETEFDKDRLEELFSSAPKAASPTKPDGASSGAEGMSSEGSPDGKKKAEKRRFLEEPRRRQLWCMLALLPRIEDIVEAVRTMNDEALSADTVELLLSNAPPSAEEELAKVTSSSAPLQEKESWDSPEEYILKLVQIPKYSLRLQLWSFLNGFEANYNRLASAETECRDAGEWLKNSPRLEKLLATILSVGNYLNGGTARGRADGFDMETLSKLQDLKGVGQRTLLDFIVEEMEREEAGLLTQLVGPEGESLGIHRASQHVMTDLAEELTKMLAHGQQLHKALSETLVSSDSGPLQKRVEMLKSCLERLINLQSAYNKWPDVYAALCAWFRVDAKKFRSTDEFFGLWGAFFLATRRSLEASLRKAERAQRRQEPQRRAKVEAPRQGPRHSSAISPQSRIKSRRSTTAGSVPRRKATFLVPPEMIQEKQAAAAAADAATAAASAAATAVSAGDEAGDASRLGGDQAGAAAAGAAVATALASTTPRPSKKRASRARASRMSVTWQS